MLLSIIIPAYNVEKYIENCIESVETQDLDKNDYEVIIINDGSKDNTEEVCEKLKEKYTNIKLITVENGGQSKARNIGINIAQGDFIEFVDSDDYIAHNTLGKISILAKEDIDLICFKNKYLKELDCYQSDNSAIDIKNYNSGKDCFASEDTNNGPWWYWVRRDVLIKNNLKFIEGRLCEDGMFTCKLLSLVNKTIYTQYDIYRYVNRDGSTCKKYDKEHQKKMISDFAFAVNYFNDLIKANEKNSSKEYLNDLRQRMNSYTFFLQVRLIRLGDKKYAKEILEDLKIKKLYPYKWIPGNNILFKILNKTFQCEFIFLIMCGIYRERRVRIK